MSGPYFDQEFRRLQSAFAKRPNRDPGMRIVLQHHRVRGLFGYYRRLRVAAIVPKRVRIPDHVPPAAPVVEGVRMRWENGRLVPRASRA